MIIVYPVAVLIGLGAAAAGIHLYEEYRKVLRGETPAAKKESKKKKEDANLFDTGVFGRRP